MGTTNNPEELAEKVAQKKESFNANDWSIGSILEAIWVFFLSLF